METKADGTEPIAQGISWQYCSESTEMMILHDAGRDQGGFGAAEGASQQLTVLREAAGFGMRILPDAGGDQGGRSVADCSRHQLAVLLRKYGLDDST